MRHHGPPWDHLGYVDVTLESVLAYEGNFGSLWEVILDTFSDFAKNGAPHESTANNIQIKGRALEKATKNVPKKKKIAVLFAQIKLRFFYMILSFLVIPQ